jgi:hypothetical protein
MKMVKKYTMLALAVAGIALMPARANAATLTLNDGLDVWTLSVQENCSTCAVSLSVVYDPNSARIGTTLQAAQWDLTDPNVNPTSIGFTSQTGATTATWTFDFANVTNAGSNAGCGGGDANAVCGVASGGAGVNGGIIVQAGTYTWTFSSTFSPALGTVNTGNIRAGYDSDPDGNGGLNTIFSTLKYHYSGRYFTYLIVVRWGSFGNWVITVKK